MTPDVPAESFDRRQGMMPAECDSNGFRDPEEAEARPHASAAELRDERRGMEMLGFVILLSLQGAIWFAIGYFICRWIH